MTNNVTIDEGRRTVAISGAAPFRPTRHGFSIVVHMARRPGAVFTRDQLLTVIHGLSGHACTERSIDAQIKLVRRQLGISHAIETVYGVGYAWSERVTVAFV